MKEHVPGYFAKTEKKSGIYSFSILAFFCNFAVTTVIR